ncbi:MAG TPA: MarR family transcriptional regulator [Frankiaceae bacterium]|nr:MarR family transcriptional regulator [Frankiaceae bacterium]
MEIDSNPDAELAARLRVTVGRLQRQLRRRAVGDLTLSQLSALVSLEQHGPMRAGDLAVRESVSAPTMTRILAVVEERGLVAREVDPADRRAATVVLTPLGQDVLGTLRRERTAFLADRLARLDTDGRRRLADAVDVLEQLVELPEE